jgi:hypothetical protein
MLFVYVGHCPVYLCVTKSVFIYDNFKEIKIV